jgi:hypothetical protein
MKLELASQSQNEELLKFFHQFHQKGLIDIKIERPTDFFAPYRWQTENFKTYVLRDEEDRSIQAIASFTINDLQLDGRITKTVMAKDLRVANTRKAILEWGKHFVPLMEKLQTEEKAEVFFSQIDLKEQSALNTFIRPKKLKRPFPRYYLYRKFSLVSLHGQWPTHPGPLRHLRIRPGNEANVEALINYISRRNQFRPFSSVWDSDSFYRKIKRLPNFKLSDFLIAFDGDENIVGCLAPWSSQDSQHFVPLSYSLQAHNFRQMLKFLWMFGVSRRLTKPLSRTGLEAPLKFKYLHSICADNEDIFDGLLLEAFHRSEKDQFLVYAKNEHDFRLNPPKGWISAEQPHALYTMTLPNTEPPDFISPKAQLNPELEAMYLL